MFRFVSSKVEYKSHDQNEEGKKSLLLEICYDNKSLKIKLGLINTFIVSENVSSMFSHLSADGHFVKNKIS